MNASTGACPLDTFVRRPAACLPLFSRRPDDLSLYPPRPQVETYALARNVTYDVYTQICDATYE